MKNRYYLILVVSVIMAMMLTGCGKSNFGVVINEDLNPQITAENASVDSTGMAGTFTVAENETVLMEPNLSNGKILVQFKPCESLDDVDADVEDIIGQDGFVFESELSGTEPVECELTAGDYMVSATVTEKATGTIVIRTEP